MKDYVGHGSGGEWEWEAAVHPMRVLGPRCRCRERKECSHNLVFTSLCLGGSVAAQSSWYVSGAESRVSWGVDC